MKLDKKLLTMNRIIFSLAGSIFGYTLGLMSNHILSDYNKEKTKIENHISIIKEKYNPITKQNDTLGLFKKLNSGLSEYLEEIYLIDKEYFSKPFIGGHAHEDKKSICLRKDIFLDKLLYHEAGHIRQKVLDSLNSKFSKEWKKISNFKYGEENIKLNSILEGYLKITWKDGTTRPKDGLIEPYSAKSLNEDVANFVGLLDKGGILIPEEISYLFADRKKSDNLIMEDYANTFPIYFADPKDKRYNQKLDLLEEYNFITKEEHEKLSKDLGSLRYLLKEKK